MRSIRESIRLQTIHPSEKLFNLLHMITARISKASPQKTSGFHARTNISWDRNSRKQHHTKTVRSKQVKVEMFQNVMRLTAAMV